jgi:DNA-binding NarL/FixJ family response regulator
MSQGSAPESKKQITIVIVDDHRIFRQGVESNLNLHDDLQVVGHGWNGEQALDVIRDCKPDIAIMDINLPLMNGIQVTRQIVSERLPVHVVMVTAYDDPEQMLHAMKAGASAYCAKEVEPDRLVEIIRLVVGGQYVVHDRVFDAQGIDGWLQDRVEDIAGLYYADQADTFTPLSPREMEILQFVTQGMSNREIAQHLNISHQTVKNHMTSILRKLAVEDRTQAAVFAIRRGWVRIEDTMSRSELGFDLDDR